ncbi:hypothetical protein XENORESO_011471 [Xenotaenia resolanae]|uniref:Uncharacterized protein n=1 Tax=Xenotaenia resolanae TaxID=208358 RepID=A0ABV0VVG4_9TELE
MNQLFETQLYYGKICVFKAMLGSRLSRHKKFPKPELEDYALSPCETQEAGLKRKKCYHGWRIPKGNIECLYIQKHASDHTACLKKGKAISLPNCFRSYS